MRRNYLKSQIFSVLMQSAVDKEDVLFPEEAMDMIRSSYGKRAERIQPEALVKMVFDLCMKNGHEPEQEEVVDAVNDYIYSD